ncbi:unnamed protein product [Rotaria sp. Silwood1]|nr:unnamed protein product [Rotaria sp. Silwood1]CAF0753226.1 unnamed protein product [Rotaria sp. Silwood1]
MSSSCRTLIINTILLLLIVQIHGDYWICDWVNGRGWMYCSRGYCNIYGKKRSISTDDEQRGPIQNNDGTYCLNEELCYTCEPINDYTCRISVKTQDSLTNKPYLHNKRSYEDICQ